YLYSDLVVRRIGLYIYLAVFTLLWAEVLAIGLLDLKVTQELAIVVLALTALLVNLVQPVLERRWQGESATAPTGALALLGTPLTRTGQPFGLFLSAVPVLFGVWLQWRAINHTYEIGWAYVGAMLFTAVSCRIGAHLYRHKLPKLS